MQKPEMILFDYGHTLVYEPGQNYLRGAEAVLRRAVENPRGITAEQLHAEQESRYAAAFAQMRPLDLETDGVKLDRSLYAALGLRFDTDPLELDYEKWVASEPIVPMEGIVSLLDLLARRGIRTGVVSNLSYSGASLERRIREVLPSHRFEFILASSEYFYRKPSRRIFEAALGLAGLPASAVWFCGDDVSADAEGASGAGIFPIWYHSPLKCTYKPAPSRAPRCPHLEITAWDQLAAVVEKL